MTALAHWVHARPLTQWRVEHPTLATYAFGPRSRRLLAWVTASAVRPGSSTRPEGPCNGRPSAGVAKDLWGVIPWPIGASRLATPLAPPATRQMAEPCPRIILSSRRWPIMSGLLIVWLWRMLAQMAFPEDRRSWLPFATATALFALAISQGWPKALPLTWCRELTIYEAAAAPSLHHFLIGALFVGAFKSYALSVLAYTILPRPQATEAATTTGQQPSSF